MSNAKWNYVSSFSYDGTEKTIEVVGLPDGVTVKAYTNNKETNAGSYEASVTFNYDTKNYNIPTLEKIVWRILPNLTNMAKVIVNSLVQVPDPWTFLPESFSLSNKAYAGATTIDFASSFINVSSIPKTGIGKQLNVVYSTLVNVEDYLQYLRTFVGSVNSVINFYQTFINSNPDNYATYEKTTDNFTFKIVLDDSDYAIYIAYASASLELLYDTETEMCYGRVELPAGNALKYEFSENYLKLALSVVNVVLIQIEFSRDTETNQVKGYVKEFYGTESKNIKTSAIIDVNDTYTTIISNKRETEDLIVNGSVEVYSTTTGNLLGCEVSESVKTIDYDTMWYNLYNISGINSIKATNEANGTNLNTIYINGNNEAIHTKVVSLKNLSRRFDIEMKDMYFYVFNNGTKKYEKIKMGIPMMFIQKDYLNTFSNDFYDKNKNNGMTTKPVIILSTKDNAYIQEAYPKFIEQFNQLKETITYGVIKEYIGDKNKYFE